jgi:hypothetical protein
MRIADWDGRNNLSVGVIDYGHQLIAAANKQPPG